MLCLSETILEAINELVHLELLTDAEFAANINFSSLRNLASNELFFTTFINSIYFYRYNSLNISLNAALSLNSCKVMSAWSTV